jgi:plastocyanin
MRARLAVVALAATVAAGCGTSSQPSDEAGAPPAPAAGATPTTTASKTGGTGRSRSPAPAPASRVDPREDGLEIALGEWALTAESLVIRPGPVTFVVTNRGAVAHGFELESEDRRDASGNRRDRDDRFKHESRVLGPGESVRLTLHLPAGVYKLECLVDGHDDLGMEELLEVRAGAPLVKAKPRAERGDGGTAFRITGFAYEPGAVAIAAGDAVTWTNDDQADHTVTHEGGDFGSKTLAPGDSFRQRFDRRGTFRYVCALHPGMKGTVTVR